MSTPRYVSNTGKIASVSDRVTESAPLFNSDLRQLLNVATSETVIAMTSVWTWHFEPHVQCCSTCHRHLPQGEDHWFRKETQERKCKHCHPEPPLTAAEFYQNMYKKFIGNYTEQMSFAEAYAAYRLQHVGAVVGVAPDGLPPLRSRGW